MKSYTFSSVTSLFIVIPCAARRYCVCMQGDRWEKLDALCNRFLRPFMSKGNHENIGPASMVPSGASPGIVQRRSGIAHQRTKEARCFLKPLSAITIALASTIIFPLPLLPFSFPLPSTLLCRAPFPLVSIDLVRRGEAARTQDKAPRGDLSGRARYMDWNERCCIWLCFLPITPSPPCLRGNGKVI